MFNSSEGHYETVARKRNSYRSLIEKLLGKNKATASEIQRDEADRLNSLVDQRVENDGGWISHEEAAEEIVERSREFNTDFEGLVILSSDERAAMIGEYVRQEVPLVEQYANEGDFARAVKEFAAHMQMVGHDPESEVPGLGEQEVEELERDFYNSYMLGKIDSAMVAHDDEALYEFVDRLSVRDIPPNYAEKYLERFQRYFAGQDNTGALESLKERISERKIELEEIKQFVAETHNGDSETV